MPMACDVKDRRVASVMLISPCGGRVPICRFVLWLSGSLHSDSGFPLRRLSTLARQGRADRGSGSRYYCSSRPAAPRPDLSFGLSLSPAPRRGGSPPSGTTDLSRERVSAPAAFPNSRRRRSRALPKNPGRSPSPEIAEGAFHPRSAESFRKGPKSSERPSCRTAGGGRSAMLDALLVE